MMREAVVFIHGLWMVGAEMSLLRRRVQKCGFEIHQFRYQSLRLTPRENAVALNAFLRRIKADVIHLVAHSLGGIVVLHLFDAHPDQKPGRVVMMGTPAKGSFVADQISQTSWLKPILGRSVEQGLLGNVPCWQGQRDLGIIAGIRSIGIGLFLTLGKLPKPNDGVVRLTDTQISGITDQLEVHHSHSGMLFARQVAQAVCQFLQQGRFNQINN